MSGPIIRKYGFPNFDKIFGERDLQHGVDEPGEPETSSDEPTPSKKAAAKKPASEGKTAKSKKK